MLPMKLTNATHKNIRQFNDDVIRFLHKTNGEAATMFTRVLNCLCSLKAAAYVGEDVERTKTKSKHRDKAVVV